MLTKNSETAMTIATLTVLVASLAACQPPTASVPGDTLSAEQQSELQAVLNKWAARPENHGVSAAVVLRDGSMWNGADGQSGNGIPLQPEHLIWIASITKSMTGAVILQLVDKHKLTLDDPISRWLPDRPNIPGSITVRQLMNHTSGVSNFTRSQMWASSLTQTPSHIFSADELLAFVGPPVTAPGTRTEYSNTGFVLLGQIAEAVTGLSITTLYRTRIWNQLLHQEIFLAGHEEATGVVAMAPSRTGVGIVDPLAQFAEVSSGNSAFGAFASARTVAGWGAILFDGSIISDSLQAQMRTLLPAAGNIPGESGVGLGIRGYNFDGKSQLGHSGGAFYGNSLLVHEPESGITLAVLVNQGRTAGHFQLAAELLRKVREDSL